LPWAGLIALTVLIALVGGPVVLAVPVLAVAAYRWPGWYGGIAAAAMIAAGVLTVTAAHPVLHGTGAFGAAAQACAVVALAAALMPVLPARPNRKAARAISEPRGRGAAWTEERGTSDERRRRSEGGMRRRAGPRRRAGNTE